MRIVNQLNAILLPFLCVGLSACSLVNKFEQSVDPAGTPIPAAKLYNAVSVSGAWSPSVSGAGNANAKGSVTVATTTTSYTSVGMVRLNDAWGSKEYLVDLGNYPDISTAFGPNGSISLVADTLNYPYSGGAYPVLTSFSIVSGGTTYEYVNLTSGCASGGMYTCSGGYCSASASCAPQATSGFANRADWDQHQSPSYGYTSTNNFPRCDSSVNAWSTCPASLSTLHNGHFYAKYLLVSDSGASVASTTATLRVNKIVKTDTAARNTGGTNGAINVNVILVGSSNINDSHSALGAQNLNLLFGEVNSILTTNVGVGINHLQVYEWHDEDGGDQYSQVDYNDLGVMFAAGSQGVLASDEGSYINVFLVSDINYSGAAFTILGLSGGILGPATNGTQTSGLAFSSFDELASFNSACTLGVCPRNSQDSDFLEMGATIAHELGHYLGLNHPSEQASNAGSQRHDQLPDTPTCAPRGSGTLDQRACYIDTTTQSSGNTCAYSCDTNIQLSHASQHYFNAGNNGTTPNYFCPTTTECQFNHLMWYTTKNRVKSGGVWSEDGNQISQQSSAIVQWDSFVK